VGIDKIRKESICQRPNKLGSTLKIEWRELGGIRTYHKVIENDMGHYPKR
jgi:hypothetical protein